MGSRQKEPHTGHFNSSSISSMGTRLGAKQLRLQRAPELTRWPAGLSCPAPWPAVAAVVLAVAPSRVAQAPTLSEALSLCIENIFRFAKDRAGRLREYCSRGMILLICQNTEYLQMQEVNIFQGSLQWTFRGEYKQFSLRNISVMCIKHFIYV